MQINMQSLRNQIIETVLKLALIECAFHSTYFVCSIRNDKSLRNSKQDRYYWKPHVGTTPEMLSYIFNWFFPNSTMCIYLWLQQNECLPACLWLGLSVCVVTSLFFPVSLQDGERVETSYAACLSAFHYLVGYWFPSYSPPIAHTHTQPAQISLLLNLCQSNAAAAAACYLNARSIWASMDGGVHRSRYLKQAWKLHR